MKHYISLPSPVTMWWGGAERGGHQDMSCSLPLRVYKRIAFPNSTIVHADLTMKALRNWPQPFYSGKSNDIWCSSVYKHNKTM